MDKEREIMLKAAKEYVETALKGRAKKIVCLEFPFALVWAESAESRVQNPATGDTPEYAIVDKESGNVRWTEFSEMLSSNQRALIEASASMCSTNRAGLVHYTIGTERL